MHLATRFASLRCLGALAATLACSIAASAMPTVTSLSGDVLAYQENQNQDTTPALIDAGSNATVSMSIAAGVSKFQFRFTAGSTAAEDYLYFGNYGTGTGQIAVGYLDNGSGTYGDYAKVGGVVIGTWDSATNTITFNASATNAAVTTLVRNLRYSNSAQYSPSTATRTVRLSFTDSTNQTLNVDTSITVAAVNDAPRFMGAGYSAIDFGTAIGSSGYGRAIAQQTDGKYVVVYDLWDVDWNNHLAVARFNSDGTLDSTFGTAGLYHSPLLITDNSSTTSKGLLIRTDAGQAGKIVVSTSDSTSILLFQLNADGTLDTTFGTAGLCRFDAGDGASGEEVCAITQQADGKIIAVGSFYDSISRQCSITLWRFKADGSGVDTTFASPLGFARTMIGSNYSYGYNVLVQPDGKIVLGGLVPGANSGSDSWDIGIRRYNTDGTLDTSFGTAGMAQLDYADTHESSTRIARQSQGANAGKIIVAGEYTINPGATSPSGDLVVARLNPDGTLDPTFGTAGWTVLNITSSNTDRPSCVIVDANDSITITTGLMYNCAAAVVRLTSEGALDPSFNATGKLVLDGVADSSMLAGAIVDSCGQLVLIGLFEDFIPNPLTGYANGFPVLARLHPDGTFDAMGNSPFIPGGTAVVIDPDIQLFDGELDAANYSGSTLALRRHGGANANDIFATTGTLSFTGANFIVGGTTIGTFTNTAGTLTITFNANATTALLRTAFRQITYRNSSATPPPAVQLDWLFSDGNTGTQGSGGAQTALGVTVVDIAIPRIYAITPAAGPVAGGTAVTLRGRYFTNGASVRFGTTAATSVTLNNATSITAVAPAGTAGVVHLGVTTTNGTSPQWANDQFTYIGVPTITGIAPMRGPLADGTAVTITGTNLTAATAVRFGATAATSYTVNSATQITATAPAGTAGTVDITITTAGGTSSTTVADQFTYAAAPAVTSLSRSAGPAAGGTTVVLTGTSFTAATAVRFGTTAAASFTVDSPTQITAVSPAGAAGTVDLSVTTAGGTSAAIAADRFTYIATIANFTTWALCNFSPADLVNPAISGATADPDGTGITNLLRYACALPARGPVAAPGTATFNTSANPTIVIFSFPMCAAAADLSYVVQISTDFITWTTAGTYATTGTARTVASTVTAPAGATRFFVRLKVTQVP